MSERSFQSPKLQQDNNDLVSRVAAFLPQLAQANQRLGTVAPIDDSLVVVDNDENDENDENDSSNEDSDTEHPVIEMQIAVGPVDENPAISWLADVDGDDNKQADLEREEVAQQDQSTVLKIDTSLLLKSTAVHPNATLNRKRPLIEETSSSTS